MAKMFSPIAELGIPKRWPTKEAKNEIETPPVKAEMKRRECWKSYTSFYAFSSSYNYVLF